MADLAVWQRTIVDEEGNVIPGAEVEVRREEDGSLATLYADRAGETPLANPLAADMSGFVRFFAQGDAYTITAVGAGSTRTWRFDPTGRLQEFDRVSEALNADGGADIVPARANLGTFSTVADVQNSHIPPVLESIRTNGYYAPGDGGGALYVVGAAGPGAIQSGDGRWWELADQLLNVRMFGAVGDGTTDDSPAFRAAVSLRTHIYIPPGIYSVREIQVPSRTIIQGAGIGVTVLRHRPKEDNHENQRNFLFQIGDLDDDTVTSDRHVIRDMMIRGDSADHPSNYSGASSLIHLTRTALYTLENLVLVDSSWKGIDIYNLTHDHDPTNNSLIQNVRIFNCRGQGLYIRSRVRGVQVDNVIVGMCDGDGVVIDHSEGQYSNIRSTRNGGRGIWIRNVTTVNMVNMTAVGNGEHGIVVERNVGTTGANWIAYNNSQSQMNGYADVFFTADDYGYGITRNMSIDGLAVGRHNHLGSGISGPGTDNQRANIWFEDPNGETVYENITINGLSVATPPDDTNDILTSRSSVILLPNVKSTIYIHGDRQAVASTYSPIIDLDFVNDEYRRYDTGDGLRFVDRADILDHQRASAAWYLGPSGNWEEAAVDTPRFGFLDGVDRGFVDGYLHEQESENLAWPTGAAQTCTTTVEDGETYTLSFYRSGKVTLSGAHSAVVDGLSGDRRASYTFTANGTSLTLTPSGDVFNWQLEKGVRPTTLIKTTSGPVTRVRDFLRVEVPASMPSDQGTLFIDCRLNQFNDNVGLLDHNGGLRISQIESAFSDYVLRVVGPAADQVFVDGRGFEFGQRIRIAVAWVNNAQGCLVSMAAQGNLWRHREQHDVPVELLTPRYLGIFNRRNFEPGLRSESGVVYRVSMYPTALTAQAMRALTRAG